MFKHRLESFRSGNLDKWRKSTQFDKRSEQNNKKKKIGISDQDFSISPMPAGWCVLGNGDNA
jgi:hypothetical protein